MSAHLLYLDNCCLNRLFDDQTQERVRLEAEAVSLILLGVRFGRYRWVGSEVLLAEIRRTPDAERRTGVQLLLADVSLVVSLTEAEVIRSEELQRMGFRSFDALHLACAESAGTTIFLTTDDQIVRVALRHSAQLKLTVRNPVTWLQEATKTQT